MKKILMTFIFGVMLAQGLWAASTFSKKADLLTVKSTGRVYEIGSEGFIIFESKRNVKMGEKLAPRVVLFQSKSFVSSDLSLKSISSSAPSSTYEIDILKYQF